ncbi:hypothetical protein JC2156_00210 [Weissella koreensis KCTC 3621]|uniref:hypothetical protein n=1 Tax=Weissella koreensis TaxID=165096 RepID=UPI00026F1893|nr:hypothetical protein [Weissella koreensis]EJF34139.1 hypothetical protein JC2156_00210 [Weissella koreensis KCTC 3621]
MRTIAVSGVSGSGKNTTLNKLFDALTDNIQSKIIKNKVTHNNTSSKDFWSVFEYQIQDVNKKIGIYTAGDALDIVQTAMEIMNQNNVDIAIIACRTKGDAIEFINDQNKIGNTVE